MQKSKTPMEQNLQNPDNMIRTATVTDLHTLIELNGSAMAVAKPVHKSGGRAEHPDQRTSMTEDTATEQPWKVVYTSEMHLKDMRLHSLPVSWHALHGQVQTCSSKEHSIVCIKSRPHSPAYAYHVARVTNSQSTAECFIINIVIDIPTWVCLHNVQYVCTTCPYTDRTRHNNLAAGPITAGTAVAHTLLRIPANLPTGGKLHCGC